MIIALEHDVRSGVSLSKALDKYPRVFNHLMVQMTSVGQESATLGASLIALCDYLQMLETSRKQLRSAALLPMITLGFFCVITLVIFLGVIPHFVTMFATMQQELPPLTRAMIAVSHFLTHGGTLVIGCSALALVGALNFYCRTQSGRRALDGFYLQFPFLNTVIKDRALLCFVCSIALLLDGGITMLQAVHIAKAAMPNLVLREVYGFC